MVDHPHLKLGKTPAVRDDRDLLFAAYRTPALPTPPKEFGHYTVVGARAWGMLGNDEYGDCVFAGGDHEEMLWTRLGDHKHAGFSAKVALADYSAVTGFDPDDPSTDQGTDMRQAAAYRQKTGLIGRGGHRHKIAAYFALSSLTEISEAAYLFGAVGVGIEFPGSAMDQFNAGKTWDVVRGAQVEGGHYVPYVGRTAEGLHVLITWGQIQLATDAFLEKYVDEAFGYYQPAYLRDGKSPEGFDGDQLLADVKALTS